MRNVLASKNAVWKQQHDDDKQSAPHNSQTLLYNILSHYDIHNIGDKDHVKKYSQYGAVNENIL